VAVLLQVEPEHAFEAIASPSFFARSTAHRDVSEADRHRSRSIRAREWASIDVDHVDHVRSWAHGLEGLPIASRSHRSWAWIAIIERP